MRKYENDCCDCAVDGYPCLGSACPLRHSLHVYCDVCGGDFTDDNDIYECDGTDICSECLVDYLLDNDYIQKADLEKEEGE